MCKKKKKHKRKIFLMFSNKEMQKYSKLNYMKKDVNRIVYEKIYNKKITGGNRIFFSLVLDIFLQYT